MGKKISGSKAEAMDKVDEIIKGMCDTGTVAEYIGYLELIKATELALSLKDVNFKIQNG